MARPREFDRDEALAKARDVFWSRGYEGTSMADLVGELGLASARIYAAFGSKEDLFREAVALYEAQEGGFVERALAQEPTALAAAERILREAVDTYTRQGKPRGCMVVTAATNCTTENAKIGEWLAERRRAQTDAITGRLDRALHEGELQPGADARALGDYFATVMHGLSVQARDGVSRERLQKVTDLAMQLLTAQAGSPSA
ncbi:TetR/AcrR family transcriptional regulator [Labrys sp. KNU-23]|uniref:TetR/AcrR family transcriptional regulator n=1 Tax=Labrys sp. KNU-23 TaxID=2789216 RepID=UPI001FEF25BF|nr:TetR/AcrR family transcriptional regulator [Labrys sp. KNU-23]